MLIIHCQWYLGCITLAEIRDILQPKKNQLYKQKKTKNDVERSNAAKDGLKAILTSLLSGFNLLQDYSTDLQEGQASGMVLVTTREFFKVINNLNAKLVRDQVLTQQIKSFSGNSRFSLFSRPNVPPKEFIPIYNEPSNETIYAEPHYRKF